MKVIYGWVAPRETGAIETTDEALDGVTTPLKDVDSVSMTGEGADGRSEAAA